MKQAALQAKLNPPDKPKQKHANQWTSLACPSGASPQPTLKECYVVGTDQASSSEKLENYETDL